MEGVRIRVVAAGILILLMGGLYYFLYIKDAIPGYPSVGISYRNYPTTLLVQPKSPGQIPFYAPIFDKSTYTNDLNVVYEIPEQKNAVEYVVGFFWGWEKIEGSEDKIIKIKKGLLGKTYKFRIAVKKNGEWRDNETVVTLTRDGKKDQDKRERLYKINEEKKKEIFKIGRRMLVWTGQILPEGVKVDASGAIWATGIVIKE